MKATFRYSPTFDEKITHVNLVGSFNNWDTHKNPMKYNPHQHCWELTLDLQRGDYPYKFLINHTDWLHDMNAERFVQNDVGSIDSIIRINPGRPYHAIFSPLHPTLQHPITISSSRKGSVIWSINGWHPYPKGVLRKTISEIPNIYRLDKNSKNNAYSHTIQPRTDDHLIEVIVYSFLFEDGKTDDNFGKQYWIPIDLQLQGKQYDLSFESKALQGKPEFRVYLPRGYYYSTKAFPVMYLLHGYGGTFKSDWTQGDIIKKMADIYGIILVWLDGNVWARGEKIPGWYINSPTLEEAQMEDYLIKELIPYMEAKFRVKKDKQGRAIGGISMGGYGAFYLGTKYHKYFRVACSMSAIYRLSKYRNEEALRKLVGRKWRGHNFDCTSLVRQTEGTSFWFILGDEERSALKDNYLMKEALVESGIDHWFKILPGNHTNNFWRGHTQNMMDFTACRLCPDYDDKKAEFLKSLQGQGPA